MQLKTVEKFATCFGIGNIKKAPGTFGTLVGIPIYIVLQITKGFFPNEMLFNSFYFMFLITFFMFSVYISNIAEEQIYKKKDPQNVVIDEVLGYLTALFLVNPYTLSEFMWAISLAFILFRFFDITKLGPINKSQNFKYGVGVVLDDFLAGIFSNFILICIWSVIF